MGISAVSIQPKGLAFSYDCVVDGRSVATGQLVKPPRPIPTWACFFVAACALIPIVALDGAIPVLIGALGAYGCLTIAEKSPHSKQAKIAMCAGVTALSWLVFIAITIGAAYLRGS